MDSYDFFEEFIFTDNKEEKRQKILNKIFKIVNSETKSKIIKSRKRKRRKEKYNEICESCGEIEKVHILSKTGMHIGLHCAKCYKWFDWIPHKESPVDISKLKKITEYDVKSKRRLK